MNKILAPCLALCLAVVCRSAFCSSMPVSGNDVPEGLSAKEWRGIQGYIAQAQYHAHQSDQGFQSGNQAHGFQAEFSKNGSTSVTTGGANIRFRLISESAEPRYISSETNTVTYDWSDNLREWWVNDEGGLEQWFEVDQRPADLAEGSELGIELELESSLDVSLDQGRLVFSGDHSTITYDKLVAWDVRGFELTSYMALAGNRLTLVVDDSNATYPITVDPTLSQQAYVKASNTDMNDQFGYSVAVDGDTAVVGARLESSSSTGVNGDESDNTSSQSGAVYVFARVGASWVQQAYIKASNTGLSDGFGYSVAIDDETMVVGAENEDSNATGVNGDQSDNSFTNAGAAYVFVRSGSSWSQQAYLKASNTNAGDLFGHSVAVDGDLVVIGAPAEDSDATGVSGDQSDNSEPNSGAVYLFERTGTAWSQQAYLKASNTGTNDYFGGSVDISEDTILVGAMFEDSNADGVNGDESDNSAFNSGAAYVFRYSGAVWIQEAYIKASNSNSEDYFGNSVSLDQNTMVIGARAEASNSTGVNGDELNNSAFASGAAYIFTRTGNIWTKEAYLKASNTGSFDQFGWSVDVDGEFIVVSAFQEGSDAVGINGDEANDLQISSGAAYLFERSGGAWSQISYIKASNTNEFDQFGSAVTMQGETIVVGAISEDSSSTGVNGNQTDDSASNSGAVYVFAPSAARRIIVTGN